MVCSRLSLLNFDSRKFGDTKRNSRSTDKNLQNELKAQRKTFSQRRLRWGIRQKMSSSTLRSINKHRRIIKNVHSSSRCSGLCIYAARESEKEQENLFCLSCYAAASNSTQNYHEMQMPRLSAARWKAIVACVSRVGFSQPPRAHTKKYSYGKSIFRCLRRGWGKEENYVVCWTLVTFKIEAYSRLPVAAEARAVFTKLSLVHLCACKHRETLKIYTNS